MSDQPKPTAEEVTTNALAQLFEDETARQNLSNVAQFYERMGDVPHLGATLGLLEDLERDIAAYRRKVFTDIATATGS